MNIYTRQIAELLKVSVEIAYKIYSQMYLFDFSECTDSEFKREVKYQYQEFLKNGQ